MPDPIVGQLRSFNRAVTAAIGVLEDPYLGGRLPLGPSRLLWEVGLGGCELRRLRSRLGLDSGYLSRVLRSLEAAGLITVAPGPQDRRVRVARLTATGRRERRRLDRRSDERAQSLLAALSPSQSERLAAAMHEVERLLTAAGVRIVSADPLHPDAQHCLGKYVAELNRRSDRHFDPTMGATALPHELRPPAGEFFVGYLRGEPVACGAVKHHADSPAEIKRMWVAPQIRGLGVGRRLLGRLEACARVGGARRGRLETNSVLTEAVSLYRGAGWVEVPAFNHEPFADLWFEKEFTGAASTAREVETVGRAARSRGRGGQRPN